MHRDRTPTPPDITPGIIARGHARPAPGVPHTARTLLRVRERRGDLHHFVSSPHPLAKSRYHHRRTFGADQRPSPGTALSPPPPPWRDPRPARESPSPPPHLRRRSTAYIWHDPASTHTPPTNNNRHTPAQWAFPLATEKRRIAGNPGFPFFRLAEPQPLGCSTNHHQHNITTRRCPHRARFGSGSWDRLRSHAVPLFPTPNLCCCRRRCMCWHHSCEALRVGGEGEGREGGGRPTMHPD